jgi:hypothetical protein
MKSISFLLFEADLPGILNRIGYEPDESRHRDVLKIVGSWLEEQAVQISRSPTGKLAGPTLASPRGEVAHPEFTEANFYPGAGPHASKKFSLSVPQV